MYKEKIISNLKKMIDTNIPIIYINDFDTVRVDRIIYDALPNVTIQEWNPGLGETEFGSLMTETDTDVDKKLEELYRNLLSIVLQDSLDEYYLILREIQDFIDDASIKSLLGTIAQRKLYDKDFEATIIIVSSVINVPEELQPYVSYLEIELPDDEEIDRLIYKHIVINNYEPKEDFQYTELPKLRLALKGMSPYAIDRMLDVAMNQNGTLNAKDQAVIMSQKKQIVKKSGVLEFIDVKNKLDDIGGLDYLKSYLKNKKTIRQHMSEAIDNGISVPKGIFLVGMPGCGKSLCAEATAACFGEAEPLLKLDMGSLMDKYVGNSEEKLRRAIKTAEAVAPCVLWIDEIEKGFSGVGGQSDVVTRMFGTFLTWLQNKTSAVYVVATANNIDNLPPELKRKGRFDEIFFVNLPEKPEREAIFKVHLKKKKQGNSLSDTDISDLAEKTNGFNGADIEFVVNESIEKLFIDEIEKNGKNYVEKITLTKEKALEVIGETICIQKSCEEDLKKMIKRIEGSCFMDATQGHPVTDKEIKIIREKYGWIEKK